MFEIADAVTQCKFEASDKDTDEVVLYKILQVTPRSMPIRFWHRCITDPAGTFAAVARVMLGSSDAQTANARAQVSETCPA